MTWQEYQEAVACLYEQAEGIGRVHRNVFLPDRITGGRRQVDVLLEIETKGHAIRVLIDAKFHHDKLDVKDVEEVLALASAVGADKSIIVAANGWTDPAEAKAEFSGLDLRLLTLEEALELVVPDLWEVCPGCERDCIVMECGGGLLIDGMYAIIIAGQCRECRLAFVWCQDCGEKGHLDVGTGHRCGCGHEWACNAEAVTVKPSGTDVVYDIRELNVSEWAVS